MAPNTLAWVALYGWPFVTVAVFAARRSSARLARTTAWVLILPVMFLPPNLDLPVAGLNKHRIAALSVAAGLLLFHRSETGVRDRWRHFPTLALSVYAIGAWRTIEANAQPLTFGILRLPGLGPRDLFWTIFGFVADMYLPFVIGQRVFRTERDLRDLFGVLSTCALMYAPLCLLEMRLSPQLCNWVYGYHPHQFLQSMRGSGYRPVVFMNHGLSVAMFLFSGVCASLALQQARVALKPAAVVRMLIAEGILLLGRSLASVVYSGVALSLALWTSTRTKARAAAAMGILVVAYPVMRSADLVPTEDILDFVGRISVDRQASLSTRFDQEGRLLERALQRPLYGWGGWGRSRIYQWWGERGDTWAGYTDVTISDGTWVIVLGVLGFVGFAAHFALLVVPLLLYAWRCARISPSSRNLVGALAVMVGLFTVDLIPNSASDFLPAVYAGALFTLSGRGARAGSRRTPVAPKYADALGRFPSRPAQPDASDARRPAP